MNILQVQDALKNASDIQLSGELQNPTGLAPSYLVLSEMKRRQQMRQGAMASPAPQSSMAEEAASQSDYYPEEQPQEEESGIEAFRAGGVVRMADGGLTGPRPIEDLSRDDIMAYLESMRFGPGPGGVRSPYSREELNNRLESLTAASRVDRSAANRPFLGSEENLPGSLSSPPPSIPPSPTSAGQPPTQPAPVEGQLPPTTVTAEAPSQPGTTAPRGAMPSGGGMPSGVAQPPGQTTDPTIQALYDRLRATGRGREDYRKDAVNTALMQAGLAMMSSQSPNALSNLGQGGLRGLESYTQEMREGRQGERQSIQDEITIRRAQTEEAYRRGIITNQERQLRLAELRMGQAAGERAEARAENRDIRLEQINQRNVQALASSLQGYTSEMNRIQTELSSFTADPERRAALTGRLTELQNESRSIRRRLAQVGGAEFETPAPTQNPPGTPPGRVVRF
jgi:hypothetical protein